MPGCTFLTNTPIEFERCYKCNRSRRLCSTSVHFERSSIASVFLVTRAFDMLTARFKYTIPICRWCHLPIWIIRVVHVAFAIFCCAAPLAVPINASDYLATAAFLICIIGPFVVLASYVAIRNWFLGVQVRTNGRKLEYVVARRFLEDFANDSRRAPKQSTG